MAFYLFFFLRFGSLGFLKRRKTGGRRKKRGQSAGFFLPSIVRRSLTFFFFLSNHLTRADIRRARYFRIQRRYRVSTFAIRLNVTAEEKIMHD